MTIKTIPTFYLLELPCFLKKKQTRKIMKAYNILGGPSYNKDSTYLLWGYLSRSGTMLGERCRK